MSLFHTHKWKVVGVQRFNSVFRWSKNPDEAGTPVSYICRVCIECNEAETVEREGHYQVSDFLTPKSE